MLSKLQKKQSHKMWALPLTVSQVPLSCINSVAQEFHIPAKLIISVLNVEGGKVGESSRNKNGTYDLGPMQINSSWWPTLYAYGITPQQVLFDPCINLKVGGWILSKNIADAKDLLTGVGDYNSSTFIINKNYSYRVRIRYTDLTKILKNN